MRNERTNRQRRKRFVLKEHTSSHCYQVPRSHGINSAYEVRFSIAKDCLHFYGAQKVDVQLIRTNHAIGLMWLQKPPQLSSIQIVSPPLHQMGTLFQVSTAVIGRTDFVLLLVGELALNRVRIPTHLIRNG
jgi:hypothetical protein